MIRSPTGPEESGIVCRFTKFFLICLCFCASVEGQAQTPKAPTDALSAAAATIENVGVNFTTQRLTIEIVLSAPFIPQGIPLTNPDRLVFDFPGFKLQANRRIPVNHGPVLNLRAAMFQSDPPVTRIVVDLKEPVPFDVKSAGNKVVIEIRFIKASSVPVDSALPTTSIRKKRNKRRQVAGQRPSPNPSSPRPVQCQARAPTACRPRRGP